jgi:uncharacterized protein YprB with RNaseH-like and TPR domain
MRLSKARPKTTYKKHSTQLEGAEQEDILMSGSKKQRKGYKQQQKRQAFIKYTIKYTIKSSSWEITYFFLSAHNCCLHPGLSADNESKQSFNASSAGRRDQSSAAL